MVIIIKKKLPIRPQDFIKTCHHVPRISGKFRAILPPCVKKSVEKNYSILTITGIGYINKMLTFDNNLQRQNSTFVKTLKVATDILQ